MTGQPSVGAVNEFIFCTSFSSVKAKQTSKEPGGAAVHGILTVTHTHTHSATGRR